MLRAIGWPETIFRFALYAFLCATALMVVRIEERHTRSVAGLSALREELLAQTMTASEVLQRRIAEAIHDGPLQDVLAARQELIELDAVTPATSASDARWPDCRARRSGCGRPPSSCIRQCLSKLGWGRR